jgi:hypothetical protein
LIKNYFLKNKLTQKCGIAHCPSGTSSERPALSTGALLGGGFEGRPSAAIGQMAPQKQSGSQALAARPRKYFQPKNRPFKNQT